MKPQQMLLSVVVIVMMLQCVTEAAYTLVLNYNNTKGSCASKTLSSVSDVGTPNQVDIHFDYITKTTSTSSATAWIYWEWTVTRADYTTLSGNGYESMTYTSSNLQYRYLANGLQSNTYCPPAATKLLPFVNSYGVTLVYQEWQGRWSTYDQADFDLQAPNLVCAPTFTKSITLSTPEDGKICNYGDWFNLEWTKQQPTLELCLCQYQYLYLQAPLATSAKMTPATLKAGVANPYQFATCSPNYYTLNTGTLTPNNASNPWYYWVISIKPWNIDNTKDTSMADSSEMRKLCIRETPTKPTLTTPTNNAYLQYNTPNTFTWSLGNTGFACNEAGITAEVTVSLYCPSTATATTQKVTIEGLTATAADITLTNTPAGTTCRWTVTTTNAKDATSTDNYFTTCDTKAPSTPSLSSPITSSPKISTTWTLLQWTASTASLPWGDTCPPSSSASATTMGGYYQVWLDTSSPPSKIIANVSASTTSFNVTGLSNSAYYWKVVAISKVTQLSAPTATAEFVVCVPRSPSTATPKTPAANSIQVLEYGQPNIKIGFTWDQANTGATCTMTTPLEVYIIRLTDTTTGSLVGQFNVTSTTSSAEDQAIAITSGGSYQYTITTWNGEQFSSLNSPVKFTVCQQTLPSKPSFTVPSSSTTITSTSSTMKWSLTTTGETCSNSSTLQYRVFLSQSAINFEATAAAKTTTQEKQYTATGLTTGTWHLGVTAISMLGQVNSDDTTFTVCIPTAPAVPAVTSPTESVSALTIPFTWSVADWGNDCSLTQQTTDTIQIFIGNTTTSLKEQITKSGAETPSTTWPVPSKGLWYYQIWATNKAAVRSITPITSVRVMMNCVIQPISTASLVAPVSNAVVLDSSVSFSWAMAYFGESCVAGTTSNSSHFQLFVDGVMQRSWIQSATSTTITLTVATEGSHSWSVVAKNGNLTSQSATGLFTVCLPTTPGAATLNGPQNGATVMSPVSISWNPPPTATSWSHSCGLDRLYHVDVSGQASRETSAVAVDETTVITATMTQSWAIDIEGSYSWSVTSVMRKKTNTTTQEWSAQSETRTFQLCKPVSPSSPLLSTTTPTADGIYVLSTPVAFQWSAVASQGKACGVGTAFYTWVLTDSGNAVVLRNITTSATDITPSLTGLATATYNWKVLFFNGLLWSSASTVRSVKLCNPLPPSQLTLLSPSHGSIVVVTSSATSDVIQLRWVAATSSSLGASCLSVSLPRVTVTVARKLSSNNLVVVMNKTADSWDSSSIDLEQSLVSGSVGEYVWWVSLFNGRESTQSAVFSMTSCIKREPSGLNMTLPLPGAVLSTPTVTMKWELSDSGASCVSSATPSFQVFIGSTSESTSNMVSKATVGQSTTTTTITTGVGEYYVFVRFVNDVFSVETPARKFRVCISQAPVKPVLVSPITGFIIKKQRSSTTVNATATTTNTTVSFVTKPSSDFGTTCSGYLEQAQQRRRKRDTELSSSKGYTLLFGLKSLVPFMHRSSLTTDATDGQITFEYPLESIANGVYWWSVSINNTDGLTTRDDARVLMICEPPLATTLTGLENGSVNVSTSAVKLTWQPPSSESDWGFSCIDDNDHKTHKYNVYLDAITATSIADDVDNGTHTLLDSVPSSTPYYTVPRSAVLPNRTYRWFVGAHNGYEEALAGPFYFSTVAQDCRGVECNANGGTCDESTLQCVCNSGWDGAACDNEIKTSPTGLIAGIAGGVGALAVVCGVALIIVLVLVRRRVKQEQRKKVKLQAPTTDQRFGATKTPSGYSQDPFSFEPKLMVDASESFKMIVELGITIESSQSDDFAKSAVYSYQRLNCSVQMIEALITKEVNNSANTSVLFRSNSMSTKAFKYFSKMIGVPFLFKTLAPLLQELLQKEIDEKEDQKELDRMAKRGKMVSTKLFSDNTTEVDPDAMTTEELEELSLNSLKLCLIASKFITQILRSVNNIPPQLLRICRHVHAVVLRRFGESDASSMAISSIGTFIFLRFINVAITVPEAYGLVPRSPSPSLRRSLVLTAKIIQNLSTRTLFGNKEGYMDTFNQVITDNIPKVQQFYETILNTRTTSMAVNVEVPDDVYRNSLATLHSMYLQYEDRLVTNAPVSSLLLTTADAGVVVARKLNLPPLPLQGRSTASSSAAVVTPDTTTTTSDGAVVDVSLGVPPPPPPPPVAVDDGGDGGVEMESIAITTTMATDAGDI